MPNAQPTKVLVVDDEANISDLLKVSLKFEGGSQNSPSGTEVDGNKN